MTKEWTPPDHQLSETAASKINRRRDIPDIADGLQAYLKRHLRLLPLALEESLGVILGWVRMRGIEIIGR